MNKVTFTVGLDRGQYLQKELELFPECNKTWKLEVSTEEGIDWLHVEITNMSSLDALMIFHAGVEAGVAMGQEAIKNLITQK